MTGDRDRVKVTFEEQSPHCLRKERINRKSFRNLPPPKLPLLPSAAADPKRFPGKGRFPGSRGASAPTGPPWHAGVAAANPAPKKSPGPGKGVLAAPRDPTARTELPRASRRSKTPSRDFGAGRASLAFGTPDFSCGARTF